MIEKQTTILHEAIFEGIGLHTGNLCRVRFLPAPSNSGIVFVRTDLPGNPQFPAHVSQVVSVIRGTTLGKMTQRLHTVEHILSALMGLGVDNVVIEINNNEPPVADGSAMPFAKIINQAGLRELDVPRHYFCLKEPIVYQAGQTIISAEPGDHLDIVSTIVYDHPILKEQSLEIRMTPEKFLSDIASARTYCFDYEVEALQKAGLAKGGSLDNAVVVGMDRIYSKENSLRFKDEFVRHKTLDLLGDLALLGCPIHAKIKAKRSGHGHNINFVKMLCDSKVRMEGKVNSLSSG